MNDELILLFNIFRGLLPVLLAPRSSPRLHSLAALELRKVSLEAVRRWACCVDEQNKKEDKKKRTDENNEK